MFKSRTLALAGTIGVLSLAAAPIAAAATTQHAPARTARIDYSRDPSGARHVDRNSPDRSLATSRVDRSVDVPSR